MRLSNAYGDTYVLWAMVYSTGHDLDEVEFVDEKFFKTKEKALKWFHKKHEEFSFINPRAVQVKGFYKLEFV